MHCSVPMGCQGTERNTLGNSPSFFIEPSRQCPQLFLARKSVCRDSPVCGHFFDLTFKAPRRNQCCQHMIVLQKDLRKSEPCTFAAFPIPSDAIQHIDQADFLEDLILVHFFENAWVICRIKMSRYPQRHINVCDVF